MQEKTRETLGLFVDKANKLLSLSFTKSIMDHGGINFTINWEAGKGITTTDTIPDDEAIDAFVLTFRFFIQDNEDISFRSLYNNVLKDPDISEDWKQKFSEIRNGMNNYLDSPPSIILKSNEADISTRRKIMEIFIYGYLSHMNPNKRREFQNLSKFPLFFKMVQLEFSTILVDTLNAIFTVKWLSEKELEKESIKSK